MKGKSKLTEKEKALLRRKLMQGGGFPVWGSRVRFNDTEQMILSIAESKVDKKGRAKKRAQSGG